MSEKIRTIDIKTDLVKLKTQLEQLAKQYDKLTAARQVVGNQILRIHGAIGALTRLQKDGGKRGSTAD